MNLSSFIWSVADLLRGKYKPHEYGRVILPFTVLRRMDCVLAPTRPAVLAELEKHRGVGVNAEHFLRRAAKTGFYNTFPKDLRAIAEDPDNVVGNLLAYVHAFSTDVARRARGEALQLFKRDMASFGHAYTFLSQIFDYENTALEKRAIFYKRLIPLLEFDREREEIDLCKIVLTHHTLRNTGQRTLRLGSGESQPLRPMSEVGSGTVQEREKALLEEIIAKVNDLFASDTTDGDKLVYVNNVIKGKLLESEVLARQAASNPKEQFANSPDLSYELLNAILDAFTAHSSLSKQALDSERVRNGLKQVLLGPAQLYEALRERSAQTGPHNISPE